MTHNKYDTHGQGNNIDFNKPNPTSGTKAQLLLDAAIKRASILQGQGRYKEALDIHLQIAHTHPSIADAWGNAAFNYARLKCWKDAVHYGQIALTQGCDRFELYDILAHAHSELGQWEEVRRYGLQALSIRVQRFSSEPVIALPEPGLMPSLPSVQTRAYNIIAFSLFGHDSKYCETAILNAQEQPRIYPNWICRFYLDRSVPDGVIARLRGYGAQIVIVDGAATQWPGPMWRFLALDDPLAHRVLFRDADSVISRREAGAVEQWLTSDKRFHMMRDWGSHTELMLAGLWGVVCGSLPPLQELVRHFMNAPLESRHFADQDFLRQYVWPYARTSLMQHDSVFGFMNAVPFPDRERPNGFHVGCSEARPFAAKIDAADGLEVNWALYLIEKLDDSQTREELVCSYPVAVKDRSINGFIPDRYARRIQEGSACVRLMRTNSAA